MPIAENTKHTPESVFYLMARGGFELTSQAKGLKISWLQLLIIL